MFTGIVETTGIVTSVKKAGRGIDLSVRPLSDFEVRIGDSISVNGICLTVVKNDSDILFNVSPETIRSTNLGDIKVNDRVNLEQALRMSDRFGGHLVSGHVDGVGRIIEKRKEGDYTFYAFEVSSDILRYIVIKGSIAVDGISLTVIGLDTRSFSVAIIPHTMTATNIGEKKIGDKVNIEVDIIGKYVERFMGERKRGGKLVELLREGGFINRL